MGLRILIADNISVQGNPYSFQLLRALELHPEVDSVQHGTQWLRVTEAAFDVIHIQWPEALSLWREPSKEDLVRLRRRLRRWQGRAKIVATVHNGFPHNKDTKAYRDLYRLVYEMADGIIHLGNASKQVMREWYSEQMEAACETVIYHGNYSWFPDSVSRTEARDELGIDQRQNVVLSFGAHRLQSECHLLHCGFELAEIPRKQLLVAGRLPEESRWRLSHYTLRLPFWRRPEVSLIEEGFIPLEQVQLYLRSTDVLVIPRTEALNSGNVILGLTFGVVVAGPDHGVIGEMLRKSGNPTFDARSPESMGEALEEAFSLGDGKGAENRVYAEEHLNWEKIGDQHVSFYKHLASDQTSGKKVKYTNR